MLVFFGEIFLSLAVGRRNPGFGSCPGHRTWTWQRALALALLVALSTTAAAKYATLNL